MPILRLVAEGVGPFEKLDVDLSDGKGNPHLGPHILAGVNGSGKSTVLKTIAWVLGGQGCGFDHKEWQHSLAGYGTSRALLALKDHRSRTGVQANSSIPTNEGSKALRVWAESQGLGHLEWLHNRDDDPPYGALDLTGNVAAYAPSRRLKYLANPDITKSLSSPFENALAFSATVRNYLVQAWLAGLHSSLAIARQANEPTEEYAQALERFESALRLIYGDKVHMVPVLKPSLHPRLQVGNQKLNFSQLPDGVRATIGWLADFMMRQDLMQWDARLEGKRPGLLLLDEIDAHLHPQWQRTLLPAIREALPDVQIIVTSHSPFVISSCPGSRVHVFDVDQDGHAFLKQSCDEPIGHSVMTILKDIFGVESRFDVRTEKELDEWYHLSRKEAMGRLSASDRRRMDELTQDLSERSESLKGIVFKPSGMSDSIELVLRAVGGSAAPPPRSKAKPRQKKAS